MEVAVDTTSTTGLLEESHEYTKPPTEVAIL